MAPEAGSVARLVRFGTLELAPDAWELRNKGARVKIEGQPLRLLAALLEDPGELVTREELKKRLWPDDTFFDFDHSINAAVKRLREVLHDSPTTPRFIESHPRPGGYRQGPPGATGAQVAGPLCHALS